HAHQIQLSVDYVLKAAGMLPSDVDLIVVNSLDLNLPRDPAEIEFRTSMERQAKRVWHVRDHHLLHAASTFYTSPFRDAAILVADGMGMELPEQTAAASKQDQRFEAVSVFRGSENEINFIEGTTTTHCPYEFENEQISLGRFYSYGSKKIFSSRHDAGKVMGLAAFGNSERIPSFLSQESPPIFDRSRLRDTFDLSCPKRHYWENRDLAARIQSDLQLGLRYYWHRAFQISNVQSLCVAGGVGLNCSANGELWAERIFEKAHFFPAAGDDGIAVGAALHGHVNGLRKPRVRRRFSPYLGRTYTGNDVRAAVQSAGKLTGISVQQLEPKELIQQVAEDLKNGASVGWFQGRSEFGPRALGARSILAAPFSSLMRDFINAEVKRREFYRPLAPVVLASDAHRYFEVDKEFASPFMLLAVRVRKEWRSTFAAIVHVDGTARVQTVERRDNALLFELLSVFGQMTGHPMLLNTSLNREDEPLVEQPSEAIRLFEDRPLTSLALENWLLRKSDMN
ncbi:MAG: carbamoyltransferase C-terminal domain-containing protein, partial [Sulfuritalea sp.]|nr:carbamoyltransferase C-terminal domain-containing protein [Sulfuritalea sp.]